MRKYRRSRKEKNNDSKDARTRMAEYTADAKAAREFYRKAYEIGAPGVRDDRGQ